MTQECRHVGTFRLPLHLQHRPSRGRVHILSGMHKAVALVEADRAGVVGVDQQRDAIGRQPLRFIDQQGGEFRTPVIGRDHQLVEIACRIDGDESDQRARLFGDDDGGIRHQLVAPAFAPPVDARVEIDRWIGLLPGLEPQRDGGVFVVGAIGAKLKGGLISVADCPGMT